MRKRLKSMARPEGFEPPAYRSVVSSDTQLQGLIGKGTPISLDASASIFLLVPTLLSQSGSKVVAESRSYLQIPYLKPLIMLKGNNFLAEPATASHHRILTATGDQQRTEERGPARVSSSRH